MKGYKKIWVLLLTVAVLAGLSACGSKGNEEPNAAPSSPAADNDQKDSENSPADGKDQESGLKDSDQPYTVVLPDGTSITLEKTPERIVSVGPNITDILFKIGEIGRASCRERV